MSWTPTAARRVGESLSTLTPGQRSQVLRGLEELDIRHYADFPEASAPLRDRVARIICNDDDWWREISRSPEGHSYRYFVELAERIMSVMYAPPNTPEN